MIGKLLRRQARRCGTRAFSADRKQEVRARMEKGDIMKTQSTPEELSEQGEKRADQWQWVALVVDSGTIGSSTTQWFPRRAPGCRRSCCPWGTHCPCRNSIALRSAIGQVNSKSELKSIERPISPLEIGETWAVKKEQ